MSNEINHADFSKKKKHAEVYPFLERAHRRNLNEAA
jgi:hypothetical protein